MTKNMYIKPEITVMTVEAETIMAASGPQTLDVTIERDDETIGSGSVDAKGHNFSIWDFDEDED